MGDDDSEPEDLPNRDFSRYVGYWHGFTMILFDEENPEAWIRSTVWVSLEDAESGDG